MLRRQKWLILAVFLIVLAATGIYISRQTPAYQAESLLLVSADRPLDPNNALTYGYITSLEDQSTSTQLLLLGYSTTVAEHTAQRLIAQEYIPETDQPLAILATGNTPPTTTELGRKLQEQVITVEPNGSNAILVKATAPTPEEAAFIANVYVEEAIRRSKEANRQRVSASRQFLEQRLAESQATLKNAEANYQQYMQQAGAVALDQEVQVAVSNTGRLEARLAEAQIELDMKQAALRSTEEALRRISPALTQRLASGVDRELQQAQENLSELQVELEQIYQRYPELRNAPNDERIAPIRSQIAQWQERVNELSDQLVREAQATGGMDPSNPESGITYAASLERQLTNDNIEISGLEAQITTLENQLSGYTRRLQSVPRQSITLAQLERQRTAAEQLYMLLSNKLQEAVLAEESEIGSLRLLQPAHPPKAPVYPQPRRSLFLGALLGLLLGIGAAAMRNKLDERLYSPDEVQQSNSHLLSVVPNIRPFQLKAFGDVPAISMQGRKVSTNMIALLAPLSSIAEAYRHLYTRLQLGIPDRVVQTILVTSPEAEAGKSTTALNLALTTARANRRTLIVDADMHRPAVHKYLGIDDGLTLPELLAKQQANGDLTPLLDAAYTGYDNLYATTIHAPVENPMELLVSPAMPRLIEALKRQFDIIIFDTPPLLLASDATLLAPLFDATVIVAAAGQTYAEALQQTEEELAEAGATIMGVVLNRYDPATLSNKHTYGYRQQHYTSYYGYTER